MISELGNTVQSVAWIGGLAVAATGIIIAVSRRQGLTSDRTVQRVALVWLVASLLVVTKLTLLPLAGGFDGTADMNRNPFAPIDARNAMGNVLLYVPVGFFGAIVWRGSRSPVATATALGLTVALVVEAVQVVAPIGRSADIQDIILNTVGALLGALAFTTLGLLHRDRQT